MRTLNTKTGEEREAALFDTLDELIADLKGDIEHIEDAYEATKKRPGLKQPRTDENYARRLRRILLDAAEECTLLGRPTRIITPRRIGR